MARVSYRKISEMRPRTPTMDLKLWRCNHCSVGVITRDREGHLKRSHPGASGGTESNFGFDRDLAA